MLVACVLSGFEPFAHVPACFVACLVLSLFVLGRSVFSSLSLFWFVLVVSCCLSSLLIGFFGQLYLNLYYLVLSCWSLRFVFCFLPSLLLLFCPSSFFTLSLFFLYIYIYISLSLSLPLSLSLSLSLCPSFSFLLFSCLSKTEWSQKSPPQNQTGLIDVYAPSARLDPLPLLLYTLQSAHLIVVRTVSSFLVC